MPLDAKTHVWRNVLWCAFCSIRTSPTRAWKIVCRCFMCHTHRNALCDLQIPPDAKTQVQRNMSWRKFCGIRIGPTKACKIVRRCFVPRSHWNALRNPQIPLDAKTHVQHNMFHRAFSTICTGPTWTWKIVHRHFTPGRTRMHNVSRRSHRMQKHKFRVTCPEALFVKSVSLPTEHDN
jgi:hypothetical protein